MSLLYMITKLTLRCTLCCLMVKHIFKHFFKKAIAIDTRRIEKFWKTRMTNRNSKKRNCTILNQYAILKKLRKAIYLRKEKVTVFFSTKLFSVSHFIAEISNQLHLRKIPLTFEIDFLLIIINSLEMKKIYSIWFITIHNKRYIPEFWRIIN